MDSPRPPAYSVRRSKENAAMDETRITAALPNLDVQLIHREEPGAEVIAIQLRATPNFEALRGPLGPMMPMAALWLAPMQAPLRMWSGLVQQAWAPWLAAMGVVPRIAKIRQD